MLFYIAHVLPCLLSISINTAHLPCYTPPAQGLGAVVTNDWYIRKRPNYVSHPIDLFFMYLFHLLKSDFTKQAALMVLNYLGYFTRKDV